MIVEDKLMKYVVFKKRTENEVKNKCKMLKYDDEQTDEIIEYLKENGYINDENYVDRYIKNVLRLKECSIKEIKIDLIKRGVDEDLIEKYITEEVEEFEENSAKNLARKKLKTMELDKVKRYLLNKGFTYSSISKAIDNLGDLEDNMNV